jgi:hypothetical protein
MKVEKWYTQFGSIRSGFLVTLILDFLILRAPVLTRYYHTNCWWRLQIVISYQFFIQISLTWCDENVATWTFTYILKGPNFVRKIAWSLSELWKSLLWPKTAKILTEKNSPTLLYEMFPLWPGTIPHSSYLPDLGFLWQFFLSPKLDESSLECKQNSHNNKKKRIKFLLEFLAEWDFFLVEKFSNGAPLFGDRYFQSIVSWNLKLVPIISSSKSTNQESQH